MPNYMKKLEAKECLGPSCMGCSSPSCMAKGGMAKCMGPSCSGCSSPGCMSEGGEVGEDEYMPRESMASTDPEKHQKGVHESVRFGKKGVSSSGYDQRNGHDTKPDHLRVLAEMKSMKKPNLYSEGGDVDDMPEDPEMDEDDSEIHGMIGEELLSALERKDKKAILQCIEACVMSCLHKGDEE